MFCVMNATAEKVVLEAMELSPTARAFVAKKLIESLDAGGEFTLSPAWKAEIKKRCEELDRGEVELLDGEAVFAEAFASLE